MKVLLIGIGRQGKAALYDLVHSKDVAEVVAADINFSGLQAYVGGTPYASRVRCEQIDSTSAESLDRLMSQGFDVVVDLVNGVYTDGLTLPLLERIVDKVGLLLRGTPTSAEDNPEPVFEGLA